MADPDFLQAPPMRTIETERLRLRTVTLQDLDSLMPLITDRETMKFTSGVVPNNRTLAEKWLSARALGKDVFNFVITRTNSAAGVDANGNEDGDAAEPVVGIMGCYNLPEIGYLIHPAHTSLGYATEALRAFIPAFFSHFPSASAPSPSETASLGYDYIQAETDALNHASQHVLLKCGFILVERLDASFESPMLGLRDTLIFRVGRPGVVFGHDGLREGRPVRWLERLGLGTGGGKGEEGEEGEEEEGFMPPVQ